MAKAATERRFRRLVDQWQEETGPISSMTELVHHPAYQEIIRMGWDAVPLLLRELRERPQHWFWALKVITGEDPVKPEDRGDLEQMAKAWLAWSEERLPSAHMAET
jgi:hypothetical protein